MTGTYNPFLVALSFVMAALASYAALDLAGRVTAAKGAARLGWLIGGAVVMGVGIWSMHFVGMLAFHLPVPIAYKLPLMLLSVVVAIGASLLALYVVSRSAMSLFALASAGTIMGMAIAGMHYIGMASMHVSAELSYDNRIVVASILIAVGASTVALWLAFKLRSDALPHFHLLRAASSLVMGVAIAGMQYTAMAGARFSHAIVIAPPHAQVLATNQLAAAVVIGALLIIALALTGGVIDRALYAKAVVNRRLMEQAAQLKLQFTEARSLARKLEKANGELQRALLAADESRAETERTAEALRASEERLQHSQRMEDIGNIAGGIAHDFNNLLTAMRLNVELMSADGRPDREQDLNELLGSIDRASGLTRQLLAYGRRQLLTPTNLSLNTVVRRVETMLRRVISENIAFFLDLDPDLGVSHVDQGQMEQVLTNLVLNASLAMPEGGRLIIRTRNILCPATAMAKGGSSTESIMLAIEDTGHGMSREVRERAFEPFFTTRRQGEGSGLGLSMVYGIVKQSGGDVVIESTEGEGTVVRVFLPRLAGAEDKPDVSARVEDRVVGSERILLVEDQEAVRVAARRILTARGYTVLEAENGADALARYCDSPDSFDLVLTDLVMPQMGGRELVAWIRAKRPGCPAIYMSGYSAEAAACAADGDIPFLQKPFSAMDLSTAVREALDRRDSREDHLDMSSSRIALAS
ncbi:MAG: MHYT domain-containing protein [Gemmatimonadales bacterium]